MKNIDDSGLGRIELNFALRKSSLCFIHCLWTANCAKTRVHSAVAFGLCNGLWVAVTSGMLAPSVIFVDIFEQIHLYSRLSGNLCFHARPPS